MPLLELWAGTMEFHTVGEGDDLRARAEGLICPLHDPTNNLAEAVLGVAKTKSPRWAGLYSM